MDTKNTTNFEKCSQAIELIDVLSEYTKKYSELRGSALDGGYHWVLPLNRLTDEEKIEVVNVVNTLTEVYKNFGIKCYMVIEENLIYL